MIFHSYVNFYQRVNLHFPMVFLWLSYGFPMVFLWFSYGFAHYPYPPMLDHTFVASEPLEAGLHMAQWMKNGSTTTITIITRL